MSDWLTVIDEVCAQLGEPRIALTEPKRLNGEEGWFERRCWVWFPSGVNHHVIVDCHELHNRVETLAGAIARASLWTPGEPSASQVRVLLTLAGVLDSDFMPSDSSSSPVPDGVSPTPARDPKSGSGAVDEMDPSPPGSERGGQLQQGTAGRHTN